MHTLSVCIITKNESDNLKTCLSKLSNYNKNNEFEIVVIDTGSTDDSKEIARSYTDSVYEFVWCNDFSAARNYATQKAGGDYILMLDTDEFVDEFDLNETNRLINLYPDRVGRMHRKNLYQSDGNDMSSNEYVNRLFPKKLFYYEGRIHEQIVRIPDKTISGEDSNYDTYIIPFYTTHVGYQGNQEARSQKAKRNLDLLLKELEEKEDDPYILYQIGKAYFYEQAYDAAIPYLERAMELNLDLSLSYVHSIVVTYGYCLIYTKQYQNALMLEAVFDDFMNDADYMFVLGLTYMHNARFEDAVNAFLCATNIPECTVEGVNSYSAYYNIGVIFECLGDFENALPYYEKAGDYPPAIEGIKRCEAAKKDR